MSEILDGFVDAFAKNREHQVVIVGYSKGGQAVQRYSLVHKIRSQNVKFVVGCGSSYTLLDREQD
jgi:NADH/NAD ratio-sensing transcriptional regulator Rex